MATPDGPDAPPEVDTSRPNLARVYDALLGGKDNFAVDRESAAIFRKYIPEAGLCALENRDALMRGVYYLVRMAGIEQFLDIGSGLPTHKNTHEAAQEINPAAKVAYVHLDPIVVAHGRALLATNNNTVMVTADLRDPQSIVENAQIKAHLDLGRPIAVLIVGILMHFHDDEKPDEWVRTLMDAMAPGSYLFITDFADTGEPLQKAMEQAGLESVGSGWIRPPERLEQHFLGMPLVPPGLDFLARWSPEDPDADSEAVEDLRPYQRILMAGIAKKV